MSKHKQLGHDLKDSLRIIVTFIFVFFFASVVFSSIGSQL